MVGDPRSRRGVHSLRRRARVTRIRLAGNRVPRDVGLCSQRVLSPSGQPSGGTCGHLHTDLPTQPPRDAALRRWSWSSTWPNVEAPRAESPSRLRSAAPLSSRRPNPPRGAPIPFFGRGRSGVGASSPGGGAWGGGARPLKWQRSPSGSPRLPGRAHPHTRLCLRLNPVENSRPERGAVESRAQRLPQPRCQPAHLRVGTVGVGAALQGRPPEGKPALVEPQRTRWNWRLVGPYWTWEESGTQKRKLERWAEGKSWDWSEEIWYGETLSKSPHFGFPRGKHRYRIRCPPKPLTSEFIFPGNLLEMHI